jgi:hypothetical protein
LEASHKALAEAAAALATSQQEQQAANISMASLRKEVSTTPGFHVTFVG